MTEIVAAHDKFIGQSQSVEIKISSNLLREYMPSIHKLVTNALSPFKRKC
jgi:hypothetical protein